MSMRMLTGLAVIYLTVVGAQLAPAAELKINAGELARPARTTVISFVAPAELEPSHPVITLVSDEGNQVIAQRDPHNTSKFYWMLEAPLAAGESRSYEITSGVADLSGIEQVRCRVKGDDYELTIGEAPVLQYNVSTKACPVEGFEACRRSGFIHPVYAPDGAMVSDDFPPEHPHQHGIMLAWVDAVFHGETVDFWNSMKKQGVVEHAEVDGTVDGPVFGELNVRLVHSRTASDQAKQAVLNEDWRVRVYNCKTIHIFDVRSTITCATDQPLHLNEYHYGGMAFRGARDWSFGKAEFLTSDGENRETGNHTRPKWTALTGEVDGETYTVAGMELPTNFRYPQPVRLHPHMPYFSWSPMVLGAFDIVPAEPYESHYRFVVVADRPDTELFDTLQADLASPLNVKVVE